MLTTVIRVAQSFVHRVPLARVGPGLCYFAIRGAVRSAEEILFGALQGDPHNPAL